MNRCEKLSETLEDERPNKSTAAKLVGEITQKRGNL